MPGTRDQPCSLPFRGIPGSNILLSCISAETMTRLAPPETYHLIIHSRHVHTNTPPKAEVKHFSHGKKPIKLQDNLTVTGLKQICMERTLCKCVRSEKTMPCAIMAVLGIRTWSQGLSLNFNANLAIHQQGSWRRVCLPSKVCNPSQPRAHYRQTQSDGSYVLDGLSENESAPPCRNQKRNPAPDGLCKT